MGVAGIMAHAQSSEEVTIPAGDALLSGTLSCPVSVTEDTPIVVMITGSGLQNRDEEVMGHRPFAEISDYLVSQGIATLRCDDRGFGASTGDALQATTDTFASDALAQIEYLKPRFRHIGALGHSEGARIAIAFGASVDVDFVVAIAPPGVRGDSILIAQNRVVLAERYVPEAYVDRYCLALARLYEVHNAGGFMLPPEAMAAALTVDWDKNDLYCQALAKNLEAVAQMLKENPWLAHFVKDSPAEDIRQCAVPTLVIMGEKDTQVPLDLNLPALQANPGFQIEVLPGLNHLMLPCSTGSVSEYPTIKAHLSPSALAIISTFIHSLQF